ncbi:Cache domain protein [uncultured archaeon]|nr:Cache domain protein [uncultured archaeon]
MQKDKRANRPCKAGITVTFDKIQAMIMSTGKNPEQNVLGFASVVTIAALILCNTVAFSQDVPENGVSAADSMTNMPFILLQIQADVQGSLNDLEAGVADAAQNLSITGLEGSDARGILQRLLETDSNLAEAVTFSNEGKIIIAECRGCEGGEGADISSQEHIAHVLKTKTPTLSKQFLLVEGYNGTALAYPIFSPQGEFLGGISAIIEPDKLLNAVVAPQLHFNLSNRSNITDYSFWLMHLDGLIAYDRDSSQIGKNLFEDPLYKPYPSLLALGKMMTKARSGHGYYSFQVTEGNRKQVTKESYWTTAELYGREWRLVVTKIMQ